MWRTSLGANHIWGFPHTSPDPDRRSIHVQKPYLLAALTPEAVDADRSQKACLSGCEKIRSHADGWRILGVLHLLRALRNNLIVQSGRRVLRRKAPQKIVRGVNPIQYQNSPSAPRSENQ